MRTTLLDHEIDSYRANGFIMIPNFLDDEELAHWREKADAEVAATAPSAHFSIRTSGMSARDPEWASMLRDDRTLAATAAALSGARSLRFVNDMISYTDPNCAVSPWHCVLHEGMVADTRQAISVQVQLDQNTVQNKCMLFLPGTHLTAPYGVETDRGSSEKWNVTFESIFERFPEWAEIDPVAAEGPAGSALFWNTATVHASGSNMTRRTRRYVGISWLPADARWNGRKSRQLPAGAAERLQPGDPLDLPEYPVVWPA